MKPSLTLPIVLTLNCLASPAQAAERPPQFVVMSFSNCTVLDRWEEFRDFAAELDKIGARVRFTYFVTGANFIPDASRKVYQGPRQRRGYGTLEFGGSNDDVRKRVALANEAHRQGHEIGSHAVGHLDGRNWSVAEWAQEFRSFNDALANVGGNSGLPDVALTVPQPVRGFRAPFFQPGPGLYPALKADGFRYDASGSAKADEWPQTIDGTWRYKTGLIRIPGLNKVTLAVDYNFFAMQSRSIGQPIRNDRFGFDPKHHERFRDQMVEAYLDYFRANYAGNRAPLHIGHHFLDYGDGIYREALKIFARRVCGLQEVRCDTYAALTDFLEQQSDETLAAWREGDFPREAAPDVSSGHLRH
jgi:hypothetical protein